VILNFVLIKPLGVYGVIVTQLMTYLVLFIYRWHDMKRYFTLTTEKRVIIPIVVTLLSALPFYMSQIIVVDIIYMVAAIAVTAWVCRQELQEQILAKITKTAHRTK